MTAFNTIFKKSYLIMLLFLAGCYSAKVATNLDSSSSNNPSTGGGDSGGGSGGTTAPVLDPWGEPKATFNGKVIIAQQDSTANDQNFNRFLVKLSDGSKYNLGSIQPANVLNSVVSAGGETILADFQQNQIYTADSKTVTDGSTQKKVLMFSSAIMPTSASANAYWVKKSAAFFSSGRCLFFLSDEGASAGSNLYVIDGTAAAGSSASSIVASQVVDTNNSSAPIVLASANSDANLVGATKFYELNGSAFLSTKTNSQGFLYTLDNTNCSSNAASVSTNSTSSPFFIPGNGIYAFTDDGTSSYLVDALNSSNVKGTFGMPNLGMTLHGSFGGVGASSFSGSSFGQSPAIDVDHQIAYLDMGASGKFAVIATPVGNQAVVAVLDISSAISCGSGNCPGNSFSLVGTPMMFDGSSNNPTLTPFGVYNLNNNIVVGFYENIGSAGTPINVIRFYSLQNPSTAPALASTPIATAYTYNTDLSYKSSVAQNPQDKFFLAFNNLQLPVFFNNALYFPAESSSGSGIVELYKIANGTSAVAVTNIGNGSGSFPRQLIAKGSNLYFVAESGGGSSINLYSLNSSDNYTASSVITGNDYLLHNRPVLKQQTWNATLAAATSPILDIGDVTKDLSVSTRELTLSKFVFDFADIGGSSYISVYGNKNFILYQQANIATSGSSGGSQKVRMYDANTPIAKFPYAFGKVGQVNNNGLEYLSSYDNKYIFKLHSTEGTQVYASDGQSVTQVTHIPEGAGGYLSAQSTAQTAMNGYLYFATGATDPNATDSFSSTLKSTANSSMPSAVNAIGGIAGLLEQFLGFPPPSEGGGGFYKINVANPDHETELLYQGHHLENARNFIRPLGNNKNNLFFTACLDACNQTPVNSSVLSQLGMNNMQISLPSNASIFMLSSDDGQIHNIDLRDSQGNQLTLLLGYPVYSFFDNIIFYALATSVTSPLGAGMATFQMYRLDMTQGISNLHAAPLCTSDRQTANDPICENNTQMPLISLLSALGSVNPQSYTVGTHNYFALPTFNFVGFEATMMALQGQGGGTPAAVFSKMFSQGMPLVGYNIYELTSDNQINRVDKPFLTVDSTTYNSSNSPLPENSISITSVAQLGDVLYLALSNGLIVDLDSYSQIPWAFSGSGNTMSLTTGYSSADKLTFLQQHALYFPGTDPADLANLAELTGYRIVSNNNKIYLATIRSGASGTDSVKVKIYKATADSSNKLTASPLQDIVADGISMSGLSMYLTFSILNPFNLASSSNWVYVRGFSAGADANNPIPVIYAFNSKDDTVSNIPFDLSGSAPQGQQTMAASTGIIDKYALTRIQNRGVFLNALPDSGSFAYILAATGDLQTPLGAHPADPMLAMAVQQFGSVMANMPFTIPQTAACTAMALIFNPGAYATCGLTLQPTLYYLHDNQKELFYQWNFKPDSNFNLVNPNCFVATVAWGSPLDPHVNTFRAFRNEFLHENAVGRWFLRSYYKYAPPAAHFISQHELLRDVTRLILWPILGFISLALSVGFMNAVMLLVGVGLALGFAVIWALRKRLLELYHQVTAIRDLIV